jgi:hypothetical protein
MRAAAAVRGSGGDVARQRCFRVSGGAAGRVAAATTPPPSPLRVVPWPLVGLRLSAVFALGLQWWMRVVVLLAGGASVVDGSYLSPTPLLSSPSGLVPAPALRCMSC